MLQCLLLVIQMFQRDLTEGGYQMLIVIARQKKKTFNCALEMCDLFASL